MTDVPGYTIISDWKNHQARQGETYQVIFNVAPLVSNILKGSSVSLLNSFLQWASKYVGNPKGFALSIIEKLYNVSTTVGVVKNKIQIDSNNTGFSSDYDSFRLTFTVIENAWPLYIIIGAIGAICIFGYLTVREVRLMKNPDSDSGTGVLATVTNVVKSPVTLLLTIAATIYILSRRS